MKDKSTDIILKLLISNNTQACFGESKIIAIEINEATQAV